MNLEAQRIAIAEWCGWRWYRHPAKGPWAKPHRALYHPQIQAEYMATLQPADMTERQCNPVFIWREGMIPDYPGDLNAMHGAEGQLPPESRKPYSEWLQAKVMMNQGGELSLFLLCHATAAQRAEALLRTIGKWQDAPQEKQEK